MKRTLVVLALVLFPATAAATPQPLPFTYVYETLPKGSIEVEQYADYTPVKVAINGGTTGYYGASIFQTEFEYGITDRLELGLYVTYVPNPGPGTAVVQTPLLEPEGSGIKERLRLRLADEGEWPLDVGLYGELVENDHELELEAKVILQRRIGNLRVVANLWAEREYEQLSFKQGDWVINPTLGVTYQVTPTFHPGFEGWLNVEYPWNDPPRTFDLGPQVYAGPTMMFDFGNFWWSAGLYLRVTDIGQQPTPPGVAGGTELSIWGNVWARMVVGLAL